MSRSLALIAALVLAGRPFARADEAPKAIEEDLPRKLRAGTTGFFQPGVLLHAWFLSDTPGSDLDQSVSTFRVRRATLYASGELVPRSFSYMVSMNMARVYEFKSTTLHTTPDMAHQVTVQQPVSPVTPLLDAYATWITPYADVSMGQMKTPVSWDWLQGAGRMLFAERAPVTRVYGTQRDLGIRAAKAFSHFGYYAGIWNGNGAANLDGNMSKDLGLRFEVYPFPGALVGGVVMTTLGQRSQPGTKDRYEVDVRLARGPFVFQAEGIRAHDVTLVGVDGHGFMAAGGFKLTSKLQLVGRVGWVDQDLSQDLDPTALDGLDELWHYDAGLTYFAQGDEVKFMLDYSRFQYQDKTPVNEVIFAAMLWF